MMIKFRVYSFITYLLLVLPLFFLPIGFDYSIFYTGGKIIANGGRLYIDFIDIKPPLVFYTFALMHIIFNGNFLFYQFFNVLLVLITAVGIFESTFIAFKNKWISFLAPIPFILFLLSFNYNYIFQLELVFVCIFSLASLILFTRTPSTLSAFILGILSGIAFSIKYPFGIIIFPILIFWYLNHFYTNRKKLLFVFFLGFLAIAIIPFVILFIQNKTFRNLKYIFDFIYYYQSTTSLNLKSFKRITENLTLTFGVFYSLFFIIPLFYSIWKVLLNANETKRDETYKYHQFFLSSLLFIFLSIIIEHHFLNYHFIRLGSLLSIYTTIGILNLFVEGKKLSRKFLYIIIPITFFMFIFFSPLPRYMRNLIPAFLHIRNKEKYIDYFENISSANTLLRQHTTIANFINQDLTQKDTVVIVGGAAQIYTYLKDCNYSAFPTSVFVLSKFKKPKEWEERFLKELNTARYLIIQDFDHTHFFGDEVSSWEAFNKNETYKKILQSRYELVLKTHSFYVFKSRGCDVF